jgi:hypothetical protein
LSLSWLYHAEAPLNLEPASHIYEEDEVNGDAVTIAYDARTQESYEKLVGFPFREPEVLSR